MMSDRKYYCCYVAFLWGLIANLNQLYGQQLARSPDRQNYIPAAGSILYFGAADGAVYAIE